MTPLWKIVSLTTILTLLGVSSLQLRVSAQRGQGVAGEGTPAPSTLIVRRPPVDAAASAAGKALWTVHCITCHGTNARGTETGPNLIRSEVVNFDRATVPNPGTGKVLSPFLKKGHPTQSGKPSASFTDDEVTQLAQFLSERVNDTMRGAPTYVVMNENVLTGDAKAGETFFEGAGQCTTCHTSTNLSLAGIGSRFTSAQALQSRVLYPTPSGLGPPARGGGGAGRGAPPPVSSTPHPLAPVTTVTMPGASPISGTVVEEDSFYITIRDSAGVVQTLKKTPAVKVTVKDPMQWHLDFADRLEDKQMRDLTAYLWSLK